MRRGKARKKIRSYLTADLGFGIDVHARKPETIQVVHQERWNCSPFLAGKGNEHESYEMHKDDFTEARSSRPATQEFHEPDLWRRPPGETAKHADE